MEEFVNRIWNLLKSMRFALIILLIITLASLFNLFANEFIVPVDNPNVAFQTYAQNYGELRADILMFFQMYRPYTSWWYLLLLTTLLFSLLVCVIERAPIVYRQIFRDQLISELGKLKNLENYREFKSADNVSGNILNVLKRNGYNRLITEESGSRITANRFSWARAGSWVVHVGFILLLIGGAVIARQTYQIQAGGLPGDLLFPGQGVWGFDVRVDDFIVEYYPLDIGQYVEVDKALVGQISSVNQDGSFNVQSISQDREVLRNISAERISNRIDRRFQGNRIDQANISDYIAVLTVLEKNEELFTKRVEVNSPLRYKGYRFYQSNFSDRERDSEGRWKTILTVRKDYGSPFVWAGIVLVSLGLMFGMYFAPSRIHIIVENGIIHVAGVPFRNSTLFKSKFNKLISQLKKECTIKESN